jgi:CheY-like chemotaxis protein
MSAKNILYVEDDESDLWLLARALAAEGMKEPLHGVRDGVEAIAWLAGDGYFEDRAKYPLPQLVLLDIRLPKVDGLEVLRWIRTHPPFTALPAIMFSSSSQDRDITDAYGLGANLFLVKPTGQDELQYIARFLMTWLHHSRPPPLDERMWDALTFRNRVATWPRSGGSQPGTLPRAA